MSNNLHRALIEFREALDTIAAAFPEQDRDELVDTAQGESRLDEVIASALRRALWMEAQAEAATEMAAAIKQRAARFDHTAEAIRDAVLFALQESGLSLPLRMPDMTISIGHSKPAVVITDPNLLPDCFCKLVREPSKTLIAEQIAAGRDVPGAVLGNSKASVRIHRR